MHFFFYLFVHECNRPRSCKNTAIKECEAIVKDKKSYPKNCDAPGSSTRDKLAKLCEPEV